MVDGVNMRPAHYLSLLSSVVAVCAGILHNAVINKVCAVALNRREYFGDLLRGTEKESLCILFLAACASASTAPIGLRLI